MRRAGLRALSPSGNVFTLHADMETMKELLDRTYFGNSLENWFIALTVASVLWIGLLTVRRLAVAALTRFGGKTPLLWRDLVVVLIPRTHTLFLLGLALLAASIPLELSERAGRLIRNVVVIVALVQLGLWANRAIGFFVQTLREKKVSTDPAGVTTVSALGLFGRIAVWILVFLLILANNDVEIAPLLAGMGIGGIAIALAVQTVLKDLLASLSIVLDKPFVIGDFLIIGDLMGVVENIGLKTTRVRSLSGEQLVFSNNDLLESRIRNFGRMKERRAVFTIGVTYQTPREKLARIPGMLKQAVEAQSLTRFDRAHFKEYGNFSLNFETVFYMNVPNMNTYLDTQQAVNLHLHEQFEREGIEFAYPTQTLFLVPPKPEGNRPAVPEPGVKT
jgi:small-conductance mechanosensitive channel